MRTGHSAEVRSIKFGGSSPFRRSDGTIPRTATFREVNMAGLGVPDQAGGSAGGALSSVPAMPVVPATDLYRGSPYLLVQFGQRYSIGWQEARKDGPCFVIARISRLDTAKVVDRFPMTEAGWAKAWRALVRLDADAARASAARLAALAAAQQALTELAELNAASVSYLPGVLFLGGYAPAAELAAGGRYDLRFLDDRLAVLLAGRVDALFEVPYRDIEMIDIGGPGLVKRWSPGEQAGLALVLGLPGAVLGSETKIQTIVRINTAERELFFLNTQKLADALRIELSVPLKAIRDARAAVTPDQSGTAAPESITDQLTRLASMLEAGLLTRTEFDHLKAKLIAEF
jgi:hypothetical protein